MRVYTVSEFREELNELLSEVVVAVQGEITDFHISQNRFVWFTLADKHTSVNCFMMAFQLRQTLEDGMEIRAVGAPTMFKKGQLVFRPKTIELIGEGSLRRAYEMLKKQLEHEGVFDQSRKRPIARFPRRIGLVTSSDAAAYTDVLRILNNRWSGLEILHVPVNVQGVKAVPSIVEALAQLNADHPELDSIILTRGGGSLEDLAAFNSEDVARAIFASRIPIVCGVGHERDTTIADLVADVRASTPSNAAERVVPEKRDVINELNYMMQGCASRLNTRIHDYQQDITHAVNVLDTHARAHVLQFQALEKSLQFAFQRTVASVALKKQQLAHLQTVLEHLNPAHILKRGFTLTLDENGKVIKRATEVKSGKQLITRFADRDVKSTAQ